MKAFLLPILLAASHGAAALSADHPGTRATAPPQEVGAAVVPRAEREVRKTQTEGISMAANDTAANVFWTFGVAIKEGKLDALKDLIREMADASQAHEPGALIYEWVMSADHKAAEVHERYADSDVALRHLASFNQHFADRLMALVEPTGMTVYGNPSAALRKELEGANPVYMEVIGGFAR